MPIISLIWLQRSRNANCIRECLKGRYTLDFCVSPPGPNMSEPDLQQFKPPSVSVTHGPRAAVGLVGAGSIDRIHTGRPFSAAITL